jgi:hypothetical protein
MRQRGKQREFNVAANGRDTTRTFAEGERWHI